MENYNKLDTAAKLFPAVAGKNNSSVFRMSVVLCEKIDERILQLAVNMIYERFSLFFLRLRRGVFWNYFDKNNAYFTVEPENDAPCATILSNENKGFCIKVLYYGNRISVEAFHSITDGSGVVEFLKSLIYYYLTIKYGYFDAQNKVFLFDELIENEDEDSFNTNFTQLPKIKLKKPKKEKKSFRITGKKFKNNGLSVISGVLSVNALKDFCKRNSCTISAFLVANMIESVYKAKQSGTKNKKSIVIAVPVNMRKMFRSNTLKNFFGVVNIGFTMTETTNFEDILQSVSLQLQSSTGTENLTLFAVQKIKISDNVFSKHTPLIIKNTVIPFGFRFFGELKKTLTMSNIGKIEFPDGAKPYIKHAEFLLYPTAKSLINCGVCSFEDTLTVSFSKAIIDTSVLRLFFMSVTEKTGSKVEVYSNGWGEKHE